MTTEATQGDPAPKPVRGPCRAPWDALWAAARFKAGLTSSACPEASEKVLAKPDHKE